MMVMKKIDINDLDYNKLGLEVGLEIHQQLDTSKLFCRCPSKLVKDETIKPDKVIKRKLRAVTSETGELDVTAKMEELKSKTFVYYFYNSSDCLVEIDCQPPYPLNQEALKISIILSKLTNSVLLDKSYVMRKQVVDGSNVCGFQRTMLVSTNGYLNFDFGRVRVPYLFLEEDAARAIERKEDEVIYSLDRLGIPLIEMVVWHDIHTPEDAKAVALFLGQLFRLTGKAKRGLGSIRQDLNISIKEGARAEIKGTQDLELIPEIVKREALRQINLLEVKNELISRGVTKIILNEVDVSNVFLDTRSKIVKEALVSGKKAYAFCLNNFKDILGFEIQPGRRIGTELANYLKVYTPLKGLFHLDELPNYGVTQENVLDIKRILNIGSNDSFILLLCDSNIISFVKSILEKRINGLLDGVPKETRVITPDGNSEYQRPISGRARMYPETDLDCIEFTQEFITESLNDMPLSLEERENVYINNFKLSKQLTKKMVLSNYAPLFENILKQNPSLSPTSVCVFLLEDLTKLSRASLINVDDIEDNKFFEFFSYNDFNKIPKSKLLDLFVYFIKNNVSMSQAVNDLNLLTSDNINLQEIIKQTILENKIKVLQQRERAQGLIMGQVMLKTKGAISGNIVSQEVIKELTNFLKNN